MKPSTYLLAPLLLAAGSNAALTILFGADELKECDQARIQWGGADLPRDSDETVVGSYEVEGESLIFYSFAEKKIADPRCATVSAVYQAYDSASNQHWDDIYRETRAFNAADELREWPFEVSFPAGEFGPASYTSARPEPPFEMFFRVLQVPTSTSPSL